MKSVLDQWVPPEATESEPFCLGTRSTYVKGCRCGRCTAANRAYIRKYRERRE